MKFGQNLPRNQVPEWASSYIDYKALKKLIKSAHREVEAGDEPDLAEFSFTLDRQLETVDTFYNRKYREFSRRLQLLYDRYGIKSGLIDGLDHHDRQDLIGALLELRGSYRKLQWYGEVNRRGLVKITKKLNKKIPSSTAQSRILTTKVDPKQFATNNRLTLDMRAMNEWLSNLNDIKDADDAGSVKSGSSGSIRHIASKSALKIPAATLDMLEHAVKEDSTKKLANLLGSLPIGLPADVQKNLRLDLLQRALTHDSTTCVEGLLQQLPSLDHEDDMNSRNCLHKLVISIGRARVLQLSEDTNGTPRVPKYANFINPAETPVRTLRAPKVHERDPDADLGKDEHAELLLTFVLERLTSTQQPAIVSKDNYGRLPLHYAAQYGLAAVCLNLIRYMQMWNLFDVSEGLDSDAWQDSEGYAPYHLAVVNGYYRTVRALLLVDETHQFTDQRLTSKQVEQSGASLAVAVKANHLKIVELLVDVGVNMNYQNAFGETALHVAARFGHVECAALLLSGANDRSIDLEVAEGSYGWTPLFIACVDGQLDIVKMLVSRGADATRPDLSGWRPQEHAALRGHLDIARYLALFLPPSSIQASPNLIPQDAIARLKAASLNDRRSNGLPRENSTFHGRNIEPLKEFGHRYLQNETMINVTLGTTYERRVKDTPPVVLDNIELTSAHATQLDTALSLMVSASGAHGESSLVDLPIQENVSTTPISFTTKDASGVKLYFDLVPTYAGDPDRPEQRIARGVALLSSMIPSIGSSKMSSQGDLSVPLVSAATLDVIGTINFNLLIIKPFKHPNMSISEDRTYWKKSSSMVIGHRGSGKNYNTKTSLQLGENTIESLVTAANLGASYVEFDVQMTKDNVPVIYHDFTVSETGADIPVHALTLEQFLALGEGNQRNTRTPPPSDLPMKPNGKTKTQRSQSVGDDGHLDMKQRMRYTRTFKATGGFKGNSRGDTIQAPFTTLEEIFKKLPEHVGLNIEVKYPTPSESEEQGIGNYAMELNSFVDTVLTKIYDLGKGRNIIFTSFHPDICLMLSFKQPSIPVLFGTDVGISDMGDIRANSLQEAIRFASRWNLLGLAAGAEPFLMCPRLIEVVKNSNLVCFSYGIQNNDAHNSKIQVQGGIDAVIVDSVARVRKGLTDTESVPPGDADGLANGGDGALVLS